MDDYTHKKVEYVYIIGKYHHYPMFTFGLEVFLLNHTANIFQEIMNINNIVHIMKSNGIR